MDYGNFIVRSPEIVGGLPVLKGTRVPLRTVLASVAEDATTEEILQDFPTLTEDHVRAAIAFAAASAAEDLAVPGVPNLNDRERPPRELEALTVDLQPVFLLVVIARAAQLVRAMQKGSDRWSNTWRKVDPSSPPAHLRVEATVEAMSGEQLLPT